MIFRFFKQKKCTKIGVKINFAASHRKSVTKKVLKKIAASRRKSVKKSVITFLNGFSCCFQRKVRNIFDEKSVKKYRNFVFAASRRKMFSKSVKNSFRRFAAKSVKKKCKIFCRFAAKV